MNGSFLAGSLLSVSPKNPAYLDPGSGSFVLQLILAAILGGLLALRSYWRNIIDGVRNLLNRQREDEDDETE